MSVGCKRGYMVRFLLTVLSSIMQTTHASHTYNCGAATSQLDMVVDRIQRKEVHDPIGTLHIGTKVHTYPRQHMPTLSEDEAAGGRVDQSTGSLHLSVR